MSQVEEETPISDHREGNVLFNKGVWAMLTPPPLNRSSEMQFWKFRQNEIQAMQSNKKSPEYISYNWQLHTRF